MLNLFSKSKTIPFLFASTALFSLSACNLTGFMDKPSGDIQLMDAARACLDKGDYACALEYYQQVSGFNDQKNSEISLTNLANANLFKMGDLFETLGSGTGSSSTFTGMAEILASRGKTSGADRLIIQKAYADAASITEPTLRAYIRFISAMTMMNQVLASAVGADGVLTASDIADSPSACRAANACTGNPNACDSSSNLKNTVDSGSEIADLTENAMNDSSNWSTSATISKSIAAAVVANKASGDLFGTSTDSGLGSVFNAIFTSDRSSPCLQRKALLTALFN